MPYITELHTHTMETSPCATMRASMIAERYIDAGYTSIVVTDHYCNYVIDSMEGTWQEKVDRYLLGYRSMKEYAKGRLNVLLGCELRFTENLNDYLVYGMDEAFLLAHPNLHQMTLKTFSAFAREHGLLLIQAHPFRDKMTVVDPKYLDGIEIYNGHNDHDSRNPIADAWAKRHGLLRSSGSDFHHASSECAGGIITEMPITSIWQMISVLRNGSCMLKRTGSVAKREDVWNTPAK